MFVRAVWRLKRLVDVKQTLREMDVPSTRKADMLGMSRSGLLQDDPGLCSTAEFSAPLRDGRRYPPTGGRPRSRELN